MNATPPVPHIQDIFTSRIRDAVVAVVGAEYGGVDPQVRPTTNPAFGDYQANLAMGLAKKLGCPPRRLAEQIVERMDTRGVYDKAEVAGPGFINLHLSGTFLSDQARAMVADERLGVAPAAPPQTVVVDYSGPNVAKEMHVGHLRSTIIGDAIARVLAFQGHRVVRQNHLGDWGTQFGMLICYLDDSGDAGERPLNEVYQAAKRRFDADPGFADRARRRVVDLQKGDPAARKRWEALVDQSKAHFTEAYRRLGVSLQDGDFRGESAYNAMLPGVVEELRSAGLLRESHGASVVFSPGFNDREGNPLPLIVQKTDGGYLYATTDLAAACYRIRRLGAERLIYVTDARQNQHFAMVFATLRAMGVATDAVRLEHVPFGTVLGADGKPFKTRSGDTVKLIDLLDESHQRAAAVLAEKSPDLPAAEREHIAEAVGIGALKYADLSNDRIKDYVFDWDRMLAFDGNTAPYLQNAYVRIQSIFRKAGLEAGALGPAAIVIGDPAERAAVLKALQFPAVVEVVGESLEPHRLCTYLYELASTFHRFYERCPVLSVGQVAVRESRLQVCRLTAAVLARGLDLLGIGVIDRM